MYRPSTLVQMLEVAAKASTSSAVTRFAQTGLTVTLAARAWEAAVIMDPEPIPQAIPRA